MEEKLLDYSERVIGWGFYGLGFLVPLVFTTATFELFEFPKMILVYLLTILIVGAFLVKSVVVGKLAVKRTPLDLPIALYVAVYTLSTIFSIDRYTSIFGYYTRFNGGLLSLLAYVALYYIFVGEMGPSFATPLRQGFEGREASEGRGRGDRRDRFVKTLLLSSLLVSAYGVMQHFGIDKDYWVQDVQRRVFSTLGQPNWLAAFLVMVLPVSLSQLLGRAKGAQLQYALLSATLYTAFWFTYSRSGLLGFAAAMGTFLIFIGKENLKRHWRPLVLVGLLWLVISVLTFTPKIASASTPSAQPKQPSSGSTVNIRLAVWKGTLELIKDHPFLGTGPETFAYSFLPYRPLELNQTAEWQFLFNKAHNEYLNIAACTGLLGLGAYLFLIFKFTFWNLRNRERSILQTGLFAGWIGVVVSNFFGFGVVVTSLLFWLFMASNVSKCQSVKVSKEKTNRSRLFWSQKITLAVILLFVVYCSLFIANLFRADSAFNSGENFSRYGLYDLAAERYQKAIALNPREPRYHRELASALAALAQRGESREGRVALTEEAEREAEVAYRLNPKNSLTVRSLVSTYVEMAEVEPHYLKRAEELMAEVIAQQPTNPELYYQQALILLKAGKDDEAVAALQKALELKPDYKKAQDLLGN